MPPDREAHRVSVDRCDLSVVIPVHNEEKNLLVLHRRLETVLQDLSRPYEVIYVDDGSDDGGLEILTRLRRRPPGSVLVVELYRNYGQFAAIVAGFERTRGEVVVTLDSDLQSDPRDIPLLLSQLDRWDAACGWRQARRDPWLKRISSRIANRVRAAVLGDQVRDSACSLRAMHRRCVDSLQFFDGFHRFVPALLRQAGHRVIVVPVNHRPRRFGLSHYGVRNRAWRGVVDMFGVRWLQARRLRYEAREEPPEAS